MAYIIETISNTWYIMLESVEIVNHTETEIDCMKISHLLSVEDAATRLGLKTSTIRRKILERKIDYVKNGRAVRIPLETVEAIIATGFRPALPEEGGRP